MREGQQVFAAGEIVELVNNTFMAAPPGTLARVVSHGFSTPDTLYVEWIGFDKQTDGGYNTKRFRSFTKQSMEDTRDYLEAVSSLTERRM